MRPLPRAAYTTSGPPIIVYCADASISVYCADYLPTFPHPLLLSQMRALVPVAGQH